MNLFNKLHALFFNRKVLSGRTGKITANLFASLTFKVMNIIINFVMVPITLGYLDRTRYGLWAALSSVLAWFFIFDIGIGHGLRNKIIELKTQDNTAKIKEYVSTAYVLFGIIATGIILVFSVLNRFLDWSKLLKAPLEMRSELNEIVLTVFIVMCVNFVVKLVNAVLLADLKNAVNDGLSVLTHLICLAGVFLLSRFTTPSLFKYAILYTGTNLIVMLVASLVLYSTLYKKWAPGLKSVNMSLRRDLVNVGAKFFVIQLAGVVFFQTTSFVLSNLVGPDKVADYSITQKYFSIISLGFAMLAQPLWSGFGDAYHQKDYAWIKRTITRLHVVWAILVGGLLMMTALQKIAFHLWVGDRIPVDYSLSLLFVVYISFQMWNTIYVSFINSTSRLKLQLYCAIFLIPPFLPGAYFFVKVLGLGAQGILVNLILLQAIPSAVIGVLQTRMILNNPHGIWIK